ncbi:MAG: hypothetical protein KGI82_00380 [Betaproteobacteria bacterium]|nr:hypothetical protein [Betaproteobacteria bacterium]
MIRGTVVNIAGTDYTVPPFKMGLWERFDALVAQFRAAEDKSVPAMVATFAPLLVDNLRRNYPEFTLDAGEWEFPTFTEVRDACLVTSLPANPPQAPANPSTGAA